MFIIVFVEHPNIYFTKKEKKREKFRMFQKEKR